MPYVRSFFSEYTAGLATNQFYDSGNGTRCANYEMNLFECMEAYGYYRGDRYCRQFFDDLDECRASRKQIHRGILMQAERFKKIATGEKKVTCYQDLWGMKPNPQGIWTFEHNGFRK